MGERIYNFSAGPAVLPEEVLQTAREALLCYGNTGIGIAEMSHRGKPFMEILQSAARDFKELLGAGDESTVLFLQGGASLQFYMAPLNLARGRTPSYINTGMWSKKAIQEAKRLGPVNVVASSESQNFNTLPAMDPGTLDPETPYLHFTSNNTIFGTQFPTEPDAGSIPLVCDASSDILSRPVNLKTYGLIYAGAQKNLGPAGLTVVLIRKDLLEKSDATLTPMLSYKNHAASDSLYNTPPCFAIYVTGLVLQWIKKMGGLKAMASMNRAKAAKIYEVLDGSGFYRGTADPRYRSLMNVTFRLPDETLEERFLKEATAHGFSGLKGHRSVGGIRASIYNAFPIAGTEALAAFMKDFEHRSG